jgi:hypothetical protein
VEGSARRHLRPPEFNSEEENLPIQTGVARHLQPDPALRHDAKLAQRPTITSTPTVIYIAASSPSPTPAGEAAGEGRERSRVSVSYTQRGEVLFTAESGVGRWEGTLMKASMSYHKSVQILSNQASKEQRR